MDIAAIIKENLPDSIELTDKSLKSMVKDITKIIGETTVPKEWLSKKAEEWDEQKREFENKLANQVDYDKLKNDLENEIKAHQATKNGYIAEKDTAETTTLLLEAIKGKGGNPKALDLLLKAVDISTIKKENGIITNTDDVLKPIVEKYADFFGGTKQEGANIGGTTENKDGSGVKGMNNFILSASGKK